MEQVGTHWPVFVLQRVGREVVEQGDQESIALSERGGEREESTDKVSGLQSLTITFHIKFATLGAASSLLSCLVSILV